MDDSQAGTNERLEAALAYARRGWAVLPLWSVTPRKGTSKAKCACGNPDCPSPGKHPIGPLVPKGLKQATTDEGVIRRWWKANPDANVGIATGKRSGLIVADIDPRHYGDETWKRLLDEHGGLDLTPHVLTGGGGDHYYLLYSKDREVPSGTPGQGIDLQSDGRYVVAPPSLHASGYEYAWEVSEHFEDIAAATTPQWLSRLVVTKEAHEISDQPVEEWDYDAPPVRLPDWAMALWTGENVVDAADGQERPAKEVTTIDRSETLWRIGKALGTAGLDLKTIAGAVANRDVALGYDKYSKRRNGFAAREYNRIATKAVSEYVPEGTPTLRLSTANRDAEDEQNDEADGGGNEQSVRAKASDRWIIVPASQIDPNGEGVEWVWEGYLAAGAVTEIVGLWKSGKTTLLSHLVKAMESGGMFLGMTLSRCKVLIITEEHSSLWAERRDELGITDNVHFMFRPFLGRPDLRVWRKFMQFVADAVEAGGYGLVILDPLTTQAPIEDENDAAQMTAVIVEFRRIIEAGAALLLAHHPSKAPMGQGRSSRGSGALPGFVDIILEFGRYQPERPQDTRRVLLGLSRFKETPAEVVVDLTDDGYQVAGTIANSTTTDRQEVIISLMSAVPVSRKAIWQSWPADCPVPKPSDRVLAYDLAALAADGRITVTGGAVKGSPLLYSQKEEL